MDKPYCFQLLLHNLGEAADDISQRLIKQIVSQGWIFTEARWLNREDAVRLCFEKLCDVKPPDPDYSLSGPSPVMKKLNRTSPDAEGEMFYQCRCEGDYICDGCDYLRKRKLEDE